MIKTKWRRFRPKTQVPPHSEPTDDLFEEAQVICLQLLARHRSIEAAIDSQKTKLRLATARPAELLASLLLQTPRAVRAQQAMDRHPHGYRDKRARLYELIDFNDAFVATVLSLDSSERHDFVPKLHAAMTKFSKTQKTPMFFDGQFDAIVHGLSREIATYQAALDLGFDAFMTARNDDAFGVDMQIRDRGSRCYVNIDCKTRSSYFFRLKQLLKEGRITSEAADKALERGFIEVVNEHDGRRVPLVLLRIDHVELGDIEDFTFANPAPLGAVLQQILDERRLCDKGYGRLIAGL